jgi:hypothetical protein
MVDDEDEKDLLQYEWYYKEDNKNDLTKYHISVGRQPLRDDGIHKKSSLFLMNRHLLAIDDPRIQVHFKDGDKLNYQKDNLEVVLDGHGVRNLLHHWWKNIKQAKDGRLYMVLPR